MPKQYPLRVDQLTSRDGDERLGYYSKGHHDPEEFEAKACQYRGEPLPAGETRQLWWRMVPNREGFTLVDAAGPGRGVFPATVYEFDDPE